MRIAVAYDHAADRGPDPAYDHAAGLAADPALAPPDVTGVREAVDAVVETLVRAGHAAFPVAVAPPLDRVLSRLSAVDLVFNLAEGLGGRAEDEPRVAALLELAGRPVTGAGFDALALCRRKDRVNALLRDAGIRVPDWVVIHGPGPTPTPAGAPAWRRFPAIVKPVGEDGSVGIDEESVVEDAFGLSVALSRRTGDALVQAFIPGRELNVGLVGDAVLPVSEIHFAGSQRVVSYAAKWHAGSVDDRATQPVCPARLTTPLHDAAVEAARAAWRAVAGRGYGRVDLRTDADGRVHVLEVNPNPDLAPSAGLARMARVAGWGYDGLIERIVREALP